MCPARSPRPATPPSAGWLCPHGMEAAQELIARQVVIQHVDTVNIYVTSAQAEGRNPQMPPVA